LGVKEEVTSPTFVLMKMYETEANKQSPWRRLVHIDAYRLERPEEMEALNFERLVADPHNLILVEWPENVELEKIVPNHHKIKFEVVDNEYRIYFLI
jgi:tRNA threonylcarbamoyl adenosine modification protein YjeE